MSTKQYVLYYYTAAWTGRPAGWAWLVPAVTTMQLESLSPSHNVKQILWHIEEIINIKMSHKKSKLHLSQSSFTFLLFPSRPWLSSSMPKASRLNPRPEWHKFMPPGLPNSPFAGYIRSGLIKFIWSLIWSKRNQNRHTGRNKPGKSSQKIIFVSFWAHLFFSVVVNWENLKRRRIG